MSWAHIHPLPYQRGCYSPPHFSLLFTLCYNIHISEEGMLLDRGIILVVATFYNVYFAYSKSNLKIYRDLVLYLYLCLKWMSISLCVNLGWIISINVAHAWLSEVGRRREKRDETCNRNKIHLAAPTFTISALEHKGYMDTQLNWQTYLYLLNKGVFHWVHFQQYMLVSRCVGKFSTSGSIEENC